MSYTKNYRSSERRALNIIWTAAENYDFNPLFFAYQQNGAPDFYMNSIIGYVHKWYDIETINHLFATVESSVFSNLYEGIIWLALENSTYEKEVKERPLLTDLRKDCAEAFFAQEYTKSRQEWMAQNNLLYSLQAARFRTVLGKGAGLFFPFSKRLFSELNFDGSLDAKQISEKMLDILRRYFHFHGSVSDSENIRLSGILRRILSVFSHKKMQHTGMLHPGGSASSFGAASAAAGAFDETITNPDCDYQYIRSCFGQPMFSKTEMTQLEYVLCIGSHANCHLYFTRGIHAKNETQSPLVAKLLSDAATQKERNLSHYRKNHLLYQQAVKQLFEQISNVMLLCSSPCQILESQGHLNPSVLWRALYLNDKRIFQNKEEEPELNFSVDLMLDASASRLNVQESIASQAYVIASALQQCHIPVQIYSFCSLRGYTALRLFCSYEETNTKKRIFDYYAAGWNRDGLALRGASYLMKSSPCKNRILIVFTDANPNDDKRIPANPQEKRPFGEDYSEEAAVKDTAAEVQSLRQHGIRVMAIINGSGGQAAAKQIYGNHFTHIEKPNQLSRAVGLLLQRQIQELL